MGAVQQAIGTIDANLDDPETIATILTYHVVSGIYPDSAVSDGLSLTTVQGDDIMFAVAGETVTVNGITVTSTDILANNGIIHLIDGLLLPGEIVSEGLPPSTGGEGSATLQCSICSGEVEIFELKNPDATLTIPEGTKISGIEGSEASCSEVEAQCQMGFCDPGVCSAFAEGGAKE